jgi:hypothetical protein
MDLFHDVVAKDFPASLQALRAAIANPDERTEGALQREIARMTAVVGVLGEVGHHGEFPLQRAPLALSALAQEGRRLARAARVRARKVLFGGDTGQRGRPRPVMSGQLDHQADAVLTLRGEGDGAGSVEGRPVFFVHDNGPGMDEAQLAKLFRPFETGRAQDDTVDIGIVSARRIVERHGGEFSVDSRPGEGTTFRFTLSGA